MEAQKIREVVDATSTADAYVACANFNGPEQTVIAGTTKGVENATAALKAAGAKRVMPLPVSAPFHCALMAPVKPRLDDVLAPLSFSAPRFPIVTNVEAQPNQDASRIRALLVEQVTAPVRFTEIVQRLLDDGVTRFLEIGPGKALTGMVKRMNKDAKLHNIEDPKGLDEVTSWLS
jgi:[acyl-carrier-protein] S-malonyltransferase